MHEPIRLRESSSRVVLMRKRELPRPSAAAKARGRLPTKRRM